jgi:hypothetical protein
MAYTKQEFIEAAFEEIGLASYVYDLEPEQLQSALRRLDSMLATWNIKGIRLGYPLPSSPGGSNLDDDSNVPDAANQAIILGLAIQLAPGFGKVASRETKVAFKDAYIGLINFAITTPEMQFPTTMPRGAGAKAQRSELDTFLSTPPDPLDVGKDGELEFL